MSFSGQIEDFPVIDILQYIHASKKSGKLVFQKSDMISQLFFIDGQIIRSVKPGMNNLGQLLLMDDRIAEDDLARAVELQKIMESPKPLGMILEEMGKITHQILREAVMRQIQEAIYELLSWEEGSFHFELGVQKSVDDISMAPEDLIPPEETNTQYLLLETMRIFDEAKNRGGDIRQIVKSDDSVFSRVQELEPETNNEESGLRDPVERIKSRLKLIKKMISEASLDEQNQSISIDFLKIVAGICQRAIIFMVRRNELLGVGGFGKPSEAASLNRGIRNLRIPLNGSTILENCIEKHSPFLGPPPSEHWLNLLYQKIGMPSAPQVMIIPMTGTQRVICLVYGEGNLGALDSCCMELLEIAAGQAGLIFENISLRKQIRRGA